MACKDSAGFVEIMYMEKPNQLKAANSHAGICSWLEVGTTRG